MAFGNFGKKQAAPAAAAPAPGRFKRATPSAKPAAARTPKKSRWAGVASAESRDPMLGVGKYVLRALEHSQGVNPGTGAESFKATLQVVQAEAGAENAPGDRCVMIQKITGDGGPYAIARAKAYIVAVAGYDSDAGYDAFDPEGHFIEAALGESNDYSGLTLSGRLVYCEVTRGNPTPDGSDYYRNHSWAPVPEEDQDETPMPANQGAT